MTWPDMPDDPNFDEDFEGGGLILDDEIPDDHRSGFVALVGRPNVGKSTLINTFLGQKVAIVSPKSQTTRARLLGILTAEDAQVVFVDTPGMHKPQHDLGQFMMAEARRSVRDADVLLLVVDGSADPSRADQYIADMLLGLRERPPLLLAINKIDLLEDDDLLTQRTEAFINLFVPDVVVPVSAERGDNCDVLLGTTVDRLPFGPRYFPADQVTDQHLRMIAAEMVREAALQVLYQEVPHALAVQVTEFKERSDSLTYVAADVFVERESQKSIVIGKGGSTLKKIGKLARQEIQDLLRGKIYLDIHVKVLPNWRKNPRGLARFGYVLPGK